MPRIFAYLLHKDGVLDDTAAELRAAAARIDAGQPAIGILTGAAGPTLDAAAESARAMYGEVWKVSHPALDRLDAEAVRKALLGIVPRGSVVLVAHNHFGVDLAPGLSVKLGAACVSDVVDIDGREGGCLKLVRQEFAGQVHAHVLCDPSAGAVITVRPGAVAPLEAPAGGVVLDKSAGLGNLAGGRRYLETIVAETGDVDISRQTVLVSVGRGIGDSENIAIAEELAEALGGAVSCSRPVVDAKWLDKSRQVGSSGQTVKPKVYLACGISGSFQHLAGLKGNPFVVAINKNPKAPIFRVADVGIIGDVLEYLPALTERIRAGQ